MVLSSSEFLGSSLLIRNFTVRRLVKAFWKGNSSWIIVHGVLDSDIDSFTLLTLLVLSVFLWKKNGKNYGLLGTVKDELRFHHCHCFDQLHLQPLRLFCQKAPPSQIQTYFHETYNTFRLFRKCACGYLEKTNFFFKISLTFTCEYALL